MSESEGDINVLLRDLHLGLEVLLNKKVITIELYDELKDKIPKCMKPSGYGTHDSTQRHRSAEIYFRSEKTRLEKSERRKHSSNCDIATRDQQRRVHAKFDPGSKFERSNPTPTPINHVRFHRHSSFDCEPLPFLSSTQTSLSSKCQLYSVLD